MRWLQASSKPTNVNARPLPYLFVRINTKELGWQNICKQLWMKTIKIHLAESADQETLVPTSSSTHPIKGILNFD